MGTRFVVKVAAEALAEDQQVEIRNAVEIALNDVDRKMSTYLESSEVSRFNAHDDRSPFAVSAETLEVLELASQVHTSSGGAFDPTIAPLVDLWGFGPGPERTSPPTDEAIRERLLDTGFQGIQVDTERKTLSKEKPKLALDLSAIAKGYAVDRVAEALLALGHVSFMIDVGGEVRTAGMNRENEPWRIAIERPTATAQATMQRIMSLSGLSLATSGDYRNFFEYEGVRYSHAIDPQTGRPAAHPPTSVSVVHQSCAIADAWATALMVLGTEKGLAVAQREGLAALFLTREGEGVEEHMTPAFTALLTEHGVD